MERGAFEPIESLPRLEALDASLTRAPCQRGPSRSRVPAQHALSRAMANPRTGASPLHLSHNRLPARTRKEKEPTDRVGGLRKGIGITPIRP